MVPDGEGLKAAPLRRALIAFRVEGGAGVGAGHVRRCMTLARELRDRGAGILFVSRSRDDSMVQDIRESGFDVIELSAVAGSTRSGPGTSQIADAADTNRALAGLGVDCLVVDSYALGASWEDIVRPNVLRLVAIDDLADRAHCVDVLIDPTVDRADRYEGLVEPGTTLLLGPSYALVERSFRRSAPDADSRELRQLLVSFGSLDGDAHGLRAVEAIRATLGKDVGIDLVLGRHSPHLAAARQVAAADGRLALHVDTDDMPALMAQADLSIGAGGTTSWERACMGVPALVAAVADNQRLVVDELARLGVALSVPSDARFDEEAGAALRLLWRSPGILGAMAAAGRRLVDGKGARRIADLILPPSLSVRPASSEDRALIFSWRNDPKVRAASLSTDEIPWEAHCRWFESALAHEETSILVGEIEAVPIGVVRFDPLVSGYRVSVYLAADAHGRGYGAWLLRAAELWMIASGRRGAVSAEIMAGNHASVAAFEAAGYVQRMTLYERVLQDG